MKKLVYDQAQGQYVVEGEPSLLVLGVSHGGTGLPDSPRWFTWANGDIEGIETPEELDAALKHEAYHLPVEAAEFPSDPGPTTALVVPLGRLAPHVGYYPSTLAEGWTAVHNLVDEYLEAEFNRYQDEYERMLYREFITNYEGSETGV